jgi:hypothetical protein
MEEIAKSLTPLDQELGLRFLKTDQLYKVFTNNLYTEHTFDSAEKKFIKHYYNCLCFERKWGNIDQYNTYTLFMSNPQKYLFTGQAILSPSNFHEHFEHFESNDKNIKYERARATTYLENARSGTWLIRHSSLNRSRNFQYLIEKWELEYYAITFKIEDEAPKHALFMYRPGWGWTWISNVDYKQGQVHPIWDKCPEKWFVCFVDLLLFMLEKLGLNLQSKTNSYMEF